MRLLVLKIVGVGRIPGNLKGTVHGIFITFALTAIGLLIVGVGLWLILAITAELLTFIANFGPIIAIIPAVMVGFMQGPEVALWIFIL